MLFSSSAYPFLIFPQVYDNATGLPVITPKSYGKSIKVGDLSDGIARFFPVVNDTEPGPSNGLPPHILLPILLGIREDVADIRKAYASIEIRMVGGSLLIIYEADRTRAEEGLKALDVEDDDESDEDDDSELERPGPPYTVKLIDFAHTHMAPGKGSDAGVLLGMDSMLKLLDERIAQIS